MNYIEKLAVANAYISKLTDGLEWNDLSDINSLHDCYSQEDIFAMCDERLEESGFPLNTEDSSKEQPIVEDIDDILMSEQDEDDDVLIPDMYYHA